MAILWGEHQRACQRVVVCATDDPRGRIRRGIETPTESSFTVEGMDAVLWLPRSSQTRVKRVGLIYHGPVAFCKAFHCLVASDKTTKPVRPFDGGTDDPRGRSWDRDSYRELIHS